VKMDYLNSECVLRVNNLSAGYRKNDSVIEDISFTVGEGEMVGLLGRNGTGKSTLIKTIHCFTKRKAR